MDTGSAIYGSNPSVSGGSGSKMGYAGHFDGDVIITGELYMPGIKFMGALLKNESQVPVGIAPEESTESWITDYGAGQLVNGSSTITINSDYKYQVNTNISYHVFVQAEGECEGLFVESKNENSFTVKESKSGVSNISFSYRIVAKRKHLEDLRMPTVPQVRAASYAYMQLKWPELLSQQQSVYQSVLSKSQSLQAEPARTIPSTTAAPSNSATNSVQPLPSTPPLVTPLEPTPNVDPEQGKD
ncbi:MAG: hypothetical protein IPP71_13045 [Bacteroidetes bacterium]|nr:hypothetical protein [Bacteroidota bacterium]